MKKQIAIILFASLVGGCSTQTFYINESPNAKNTLPNREDTSHFFVYGIGQKDEIMPAEVCGDIKNVGKIEVKQTFLDGVLGMITSGIYMPRSKRIYCTK